MPVEHQQKVSWRTPVFEGSHPLNRAAYQRFDQGEAL